LLARQNARKTGHRALSVDYRKGPLDCFLATFENAQDVLKATLPNASVMAAGTYLRRKVNQVVRCPERLVYESISILGFSTGRNLALKLSLQKGTA